MKKIGIAIALMFVSLTAFSQFGIKGGFALGVGVNKNSNNPAYPGFDLGVTYNISDDFRVEALFEGMFHGQKNGGVSVTTGVLPFTFGADYSFLNGIARPYLGFNLGSYSRTSKTNTNILGVTAQNKANATHFGLYPKLGVNIELSQSLLLDVAAKYHVIFDNNGNSNVAPTQLFGLNVGINYIF